MFRVNPTILRCKVNWILNLLTALFLPYIKTLLKNTSGSPRLFKGYSDTDKCKRREGIYNWQHGDISIRYVFPSSSRFEAHIYLALCKTSSFQPHFWTLLTSPWVGSFWRKVIALYSGPVWVRGGVGDRRAGGEEEGMVWELQSKGGLSVLFSPGQVEDKHGYSPLISIFFLGNSIRREAWEHYFCFKARSTSCFEEDFKILP